MTNDVESGAAEDAIDAHQHIWRRDSGFHHWLKPENDILFRDYLPDDLAPLLQRAGVSATIAIQASAVDGDTDFLLETADRHDAIAGVVGWVDPYAPDMECRLRSLASNRKFRGIRPSLRREAGQTFELDDRFHQMVALAGQLGLSIDLLVRAHQLPALVHLIDAHPDVRMVLNHGGGPDSKALDAWSTDIRALATRPMLMCKLSGLVTLSPPLDSIQTEFVVGEILGAFGPTRVMWGSDWPVLNLASDYANWKAYAGELVLRLAGAEALPFVMREAARNFYGVANDNDCKD